MPYTLDDIGKYMENFNAKLDEVKNSLENSISAVRNDIFTHVADFELTVHQKLTSVNDQMAHHNSRIHNLEKHAIKNDVIVTGVPKSPNENTKQIFDVICNVIGFTYANTYSVFRLPSNKAYSPIIVKFYNDNIKSNFFVNYKNFKKLYLSQIGYEIPIDGDDKRIYINNCLTKQCRDIKAEANALFKKGILGKVQIIRGDVHVTKTGEKFSTKILCTDQLKELIQ